MENIKTWKIWAHFMAYILCFVLGAVITALPRIIYGFENESGLFVFITELLRIPFTIVLLFFYTKFISGHSLNDETLSTTGFNFWIWGSVGLTLPFAVLLIFYLSGNLNVLATNFYLSDVTILDSVLKMLGMALAAGIVEELVFRGYLVNLLSKKYSFWVSGIVPSFLFTILHLGAAKSLINVFQLLVAGMLVSIMFLAIYKKTGSIWNASIVHFLWNFLFLKELVDYGDGKGPLNKIIEVDLGDNQLLTGGAFGLDVSLPSIIVYCITILIIFKCFKGRNSANIPKWKK